MKLRGWWLNLLGVCSGGLLVRAFKFVKHGIIILLFVHELLGFT